MSEIVTYPEVYKKTGAGKTQVWYMQIDGDKYRSFTGHVDGKMNTSEWTTAVPTNVGKSNERLGPAQAVFDVEAMYKKKTDKEYHYDINNIETAKHFLPMLALELEKVKDSIGYSDPFYAQPKLDGYRAVIQNDCKLKSRNGKPFVAAPHITEYLKPLFAKYPDLILDGELYNHDYCDDFYELSSIFKTQKVTAEDLELSEKVTQYHVYDMPSVKGLYSERYAALQKLFADEDVNKYLRLVDTTFILAFDIESHYERMLDLGYEGQILRRNAMYENKRTKNLIKNKPFDDAEFIIIAIEEGKGNWAGKAKKVKFLLDPTKPATEDNIGGAGIKGEKAFLVEVLKNRDYYLMKPTTIRYFGKTKDGKPRHGRVKEFARSDV